MELVDTTGADAAFMSLRLGAQAAGASLDTTVRLAVDAAHDVSLVLNLSRFKNENRSQALVRCCVREALTTAR
jgi:sugar/nucleoside kinase (ribokinase family)